MRRQRSHVAPISGRARIAASWLLPWIVAGLCACSAPAPQRATDRAAPQRAADRPGGEAHLAFQGQILGTDGPGGATLVPLAARPARTSVKLVWSRASTPGAPGVPAERGVTHARLLATPGPATWPGDARPRTGGPVARPAPAWRAALWMSAVAVTTLLTRAPMDMDVGADLGGPVDGAPAGAALAAGLLASLTGHPVDPAASALGVVLPDGSLGMVPDLPARLEAAAAAGIERLGHAGLAGMLDADRDVLAQRARALGVKLVTLHDVRDAHALLTGQRLPAPTPVARSAMVLDAGELTHLEDRFQAWRALVATAWSDMLELTGPQRLPPELDALARAARHHAAAAERLWRDRRVIPAQDRMQRAAALALAAQATWRVHERIQAGDLAGARERLDELAAWPDAGDAALSAHEPATLHDHLLHLAALERALRAGALGQHGHQELARAHTLLAHLDPDPDADDPPAPRAHRDIQRALVAHLALAAEALARARVESQAAHHALTAPRHRARPHALTPSLAHRLAAPYAAVAAAHLDASAAPSSSVRRVLAQTLLARPHRPPDPDIAPDRAASLLDLASALAAYRDTSLLVALDDLADPRGFLDEHAGDAPGAGRHEDERLRRMLARAERKAREHARAAQVATGSIPMQSRLTYQRARHTREATPIQALELYWASSLTSQLAVILASTAPRTPPAPDAHD